MATFERTPEYEDAELYTGRRLQRVLTIVDIGNSTEPLEDITFLLREVVTRTLQFEEEYGYHGMLLDDTQAFITVIKHAFDQKQQFDHRTRCAINLLLGKTMRDLIGQEEMTDAIRSSITERQYAVVMRKLELCERSPTREQQQNLALSTLIIDEDLTPDSLPNPGELQKLIAKKPWNRFFSSSEELLRALQRRGWTPQNPHE